MLEERNHALMEHSQKVEDEYGSLIAFKSLMESYKDQVAELQTQNKELIRQKNKTEYELTMANKKLDLMDEERLRDSDRIQLLEDNLQEAQFGSKCVLVCFFFFSFFFLLKVHVLVGSIVTDKPAVKGVSTVDTEDMDYDDFNLNESLEDTLKETNVTEL